MLPTVMCDVDVGKIANGIDFDLERYTDGLHAFGAEDGDIEPLAIELASPRHGIFSPIEEYAHGYYLYDDNKIVININGVDGIRTSTELNLALVHETRHFLDQKVGKPRRTRLYSAGVSAAIGGATAALCMHQGEMAVVPVASFSASFAFNALLAGLDRAASKNQLFYRLSPMERRARKFADNPRTLNIFGNVISLATR